MSFRATAPVVNDRVLGCASGKPAFTTKHTKHAKLQRCLQSARSLDFLVRLVCLVFD
jgi:hypothetical protein